MAVLIARLHRSLTFLDQSPTFVGKLNVSWLVISTWIFLIPNVDVHVEHDCFLFMQIEAIFSSVFAFGFRLSRYLGQDHYRCSIKYKVVQFLSV